MSSPPCSGAHAVGASAAAVCRRLSLYAFSFLKRPPTRMLLIGLGAGQLVTLAERRSLCVSLRLWLLASGSSAATRQTDGALGVDAPVCLEYLRAKRGHNVAESAAAWFHDLSRDNVAVHNGNPWDCGQM